MLNNYDEHITVLLIGSSPIEYQPKGRETSIVLQWHECAIAWKMVFSTERKGGRSWKSIEHFSTLPFGWIPKDGVDFFSLFIEYLSRRWHLFCISAEERLLQQVRRPTLYSSNMLIKLYSSVFIKWTQKEIAPNSFIALQRI